MTLRYEDLKKKLIETFKNEVNIITRKLSERRKILIKFPNDTSEFSDLINEKFTEIKKNMYNAKVHWAESTIEFFINDNDNTDYFNELRRDLQTYDFLESIFRYIAKHE